MTLRCKAGDVAIVVYDTLECASSIGRFVRIIGSVEFSTRYDKWCWLIVPVAPGLWMVERGGRVSPEQVTNHSRVEHPDDWLKPIPPEVLDEDAERAREKLDAWLLKLRVVPAADARKTAQTTTYPTGASSVSDAVPPCIEHDMTNQNYLFTSESVAEGHPDKVADQISDRILDAFLARDPSARVACETLLADQYVVVAGEFRTRDEAVFRDIEAAAESIVRKTLADIGYTDAATGIDPRRCEIRIAFNHQSSEIGQGVDRADGELGAGDQGLMFGYACDETPELMPLAISLAHRLVRRQADLRKSGALPWLRPDAKSQVTVRYEGGRPVAVEKVVLSTQHAESIDTDTLRAEVLRHSIDPVVPAELRSPGFEALINPTGCFTVGGPKGDTGLTGRKIIVDTYGGACPHGGGAFSGKDPSKVDRSAAYMARHIAKSLVAGGLARRCLIQLAYAIGVVEPVSVMIDTYGTGTRPDEELEALVRERFRLTPRGIIESLGLERPIYAQTASYGHFGRTDIELPWEKVA